MTATAERKVPGGKLLRVDVEASDVIQRVGLHGDFFVYPEEALETIETAVEGAAADASAADLAARIQDAVGDAELVGFGPADVAAVVREAIDDA